jgi:hypothetical protein
MFRGGFQLFKKKFTDAFRPRSRKPSRDIDAVAIEVVALDDFRRRAVDDARSATDRRDAARRPLPATFGN